MGTDLDTEDNQETIYQDLDLNGNPARKDIIIILAFDLYNQVNDTAISARMIQRYGLGYIYAQSAYRWYIHNEWGKLSFCWVVKIVFPFVRE